jgi:Fe-S cluster assembly protein SufD
MTTTAAFLKMPLPPGDEPLRLLRRSALQYVSDHGFPTHKDESWKYTRVAPILEVPFELVPTGTNHGLSGDAMDRLAGNFGGTRLIFVNGHFAPELSSFGPLPDGVQIRSSGFADFTIPNRDRLRAEGAAPPHAFTALNTALTQGGAFIRIPKNTLVETPISLVFLSDVGATPGNTPLMSHPKSLVIAEAGSRATIIEVYAGIQDALYWTNSVTDMILDEGAEVTHYKIQNEAEKAFHLALLNVNQRGRGSRFATHGVALGGAIAREEVNVTLTGPGSEAALEGLYLPRNGQYLDHPILVEHLAPDCKSRQFYKGVMEGKGRGGFYGQIIVRPGAMKTDASQTNKNLLLSESSQVDTRPRLEIFADDVKCAHGAAVGQLDEEAIFYLCSRGVPVQAARGLLISAFANEMVDRMPLIPVRSHVKRMLSSRFGSCVPGE